MLASPINPSDLLVVQGQYGKLPPLPATPGFEGVGIVEKNGGGLLGWRVLGKRVAVLNGVGGNWQEQVVIPSRQAVPVPRDLPDEQAATFFVNPATAVVMTTRVLRIPRGAWLVQTAAASALGQMVVRLGRHLGFRTLNVVRRREAAELLQRLGADAVINSAEESIEERVRAVTGNQGARFALDAVGGATGSAVVRALAPGGRLLVYGTLASEPLTLDPRTLMVGSKRVEGFWLSEWIRAQGPLTMLGLFRKVARLIRAGILTTPIGASYPLEQITAAVRKASEPGRDGKVLLRMG
jgi:NADPH:quinone reductase-like Zn-dependent oxidoreductase